LPWLTQFKQVWRGEREAAASTACGFVVVCLVLATAARWGIAEMRVDQPFALYLPAVLLTTVFGGVRAGIWTSVLGAILGYSIDFEAAPTGAARMALLVLYVIVAGLIIWGAMHHRSIARYYRDLSTKLQKEEDYRELIVGELSHRLKNTLASVHAIVHQILRDQPET
jgi:hypothetical protein